MSLSEEQLYTSVGLLWDIWQKNTWDVRVGNYCRSNMSVSNPNSTRFGIKTSAIHRSIIPKVLVGLWFWHQVPWDEISEGSTKKLNEKTEVAPPTGYSWYEETCIFGVHQKSLHQMENLSSILSMGRSLGWLSKSQPQEVEEGRKGRPESKNHGTTHACHIDFRQSIPLARG